MSEDSSKTAMEKDRDGAATASQHLNLSSEEQNLLEELGNFASMLSGPEVTEPVPNPQADFGIGLVNYTINFPPMEEDLVPEKLLRLDEVIKEEQRLGDALIKFQAFILGLQAGREDPVPWLPAAQRVAIRIQIREKSTNTILRENLASMKEFPNLAVYGLVRRCEKTHSFPNPAEIAVFAEMDAVLVSRFRAIVSDKAYCARIRGYLSKCWREKMMVSGTRKLYSRCLRRPSQRIKRPRLEATMRKIKQVIKDGKHKATAEC